MARRHRVSGPIVRIAIALLLLVGAMGMVRHFWRREPRLPAYVPTEPEVAAIMLDLADIRPTDVVYDLGCGDGRLVIKALRSGAARGVCVDIDPLRMLDGIRFAHYAGVLDRFKFIVADVRKVDFSDATVVFLYLGRSLNLELRSRLRALPPGTRVVSHWHDMGDWVPDRTERVTGNRFGLRPVYEWTVR